MKELFIPHQEALEMKKLLFDEPCFGLYNQIKELCYPQLHYGEWKSFHDQEDPWITLAPLYSQAFKWFRENYGLEIILRPDSINAPEKKLREYVILSYDKNWVLEPIAEPHWWIRKGLFKTPEEAELACLRKLIELVKQQS